MTRRLVQVVVPVKFKADISAHGFWKLGTTVMFNITILNLDAGSYLRMTNENDLAKADLQAFMEHISYFNPVLYYVDGIHRAEALEAQKRLAALLSSKLKREYPKLCGFVLPRISLAVVRSNSLFLCGPWEKEARIQHQLELLDGVLMALLVP